MGRRGKNSKKKRNNERVSEELVKGLDKVLIDHGKNYPVVPGLCRSLVPLAPPSIRVVLRYAFRTTMTVTVGNSPLQQFSGNGLFDPDVTGIGSQPLGFDQWMALYQRYRCLASAISFNLSTPDAATNDAQTLRVVLVPSVIATSFTNIDSAASQPYAIDRYINAVIPNRDSRITGVMETSTITGRPKAAVLADDTLAGTSAGNPFDPWNWHIMATTMDAAASAAIVVIGEVHYLVDFYDRNLLTLSDDDFKKRKLVKKVSKSKL